MSVERVVMFILLLVILLPSFTLALNTGTPNVKATLISQSPDPVEPGSIVTVKFKIENNGTETAQEIISQVIPNYPFSLYGDTPDKNLGMLKAAATGADAVTVEYKLKVDEKATAGDTELELKLQMGEAAVSYVKDNFLIHIQSRDAMLEIVSVELDPKIITAGEPTQVTITVKNYATSTLKNIRFRLGLSSSTVPFAPYRSSSEKLIPSLERLYQNSVSFSLISDPAAKSGLYKVPLNLSFEDAWGNDYVINEILALSIGETPKVRTYVKKSTVYQSDTAGKITLEVANAGTNNIKFLELTLLPSEDYELVSTSNYFYIGDVDSDDTGSEDIDIYVKNPNDDVLKIPVLLKYTDANNKKLQQQFDLELKLHSSSELRKFGILPASYMGVYVLIIILVLGGFWYIKFGRHNPKVQSWIMKKKFW